MNFSAAAAAEKRSDEEIAVIVCDTGRGILPKDVPRIFQKFYRGAKPHSDSSTDGTPDDAAGKAETPGVGLGLYLAKRLVNALDGRITVNSEVGRGSCFTIYLPVWDEDKHEKDTLDEYDFDEKHHEENVTVNRRPVNREVSDADMANFKDGDFTVTTQAEEAVVGKESRVVEEVVIGKKTTEREETIRDTVRRTDVEVDEINTGEAAHCKNG